ncbi:MAG: LPS assembly lipoprotein LptE [Limisphaerales bacterium]
MNRLRCLLAFLGALALTGCAGYRLGPTNGIAAGSRSVQINFFANQTLEPRLSQAITHSLRQRFQQDGTYRLATRNDGDLVVSGTILRYERSALTFQPKDIVSVRDFEVTVFCQVVATERATGEKVIDQQVQGRATVRVFEDQTSAERQVQPMLADDLARNAAALIVDGSW